MPTLTSLINSIDQRPYFEVRLNGVPVYDVVRVETDYSFDQNSASCRITTPTYYSFEPGMVYTLEVKEGYAGYSHPSFFGFIDDIHESRFPNLYEISARDVLKKAEETWLDDQGVSYTNTQAESAVSDLLSRAGLTRTNLGTTNFTIGDVNPAEFKLVSVLDAVLQIAALIGWHVWATPDGTVMFQYKKPLPGANIIWTYREPTTPSAKDGNILTYKYTRTDRNLRNRVVVVGYNDIRSTAQADSPYVPNPPQYRTAILSSELVDTQSMANVISGWMLGDLNHLTESVEMDVPGNPYLSVGSTIKVIESQSGQNANYCVFSLRSENDGSRGEYLMRLTCVGGNSSPIGYGGGGAGVGEEPTANMNVVASFTYQQTAWGDPTYVVFVDGQSSSAPDATITNYEWNWGDGDPVTSGASPYAAHKYTTAGSYTITLTVTTSTGSTGTASQTIAVGDSSDANYVNRVIFAGGNSKVYGTFDSGQTWNSVAVASAVNAIDACVTKLNGAVIAGCQGGQLYRVLAFGGSVSLNHTFGAAVKSVYVNQSDDSIWLVGLSNGQLWKGTSYGSTWTLVKTFAGTVARHAFIDPTAVTHWMVPGTTYLQETMDSGASWHDLLLNFSNGSMTAVRYSAWHFMQHILVGVTGGTKPLGYSADGGATWTGCTGVTDTTPNAVSGGITDPGEFCAAFSGANYVWKTSNGVAFTQGGNFAGLTEANDLRADGFLPLVYFAGG